MRTDDVVDVIHGVPVRDPYRWLEDGSSPEVAAWVDEQNRRTRAVLDALPHRRVLHGRLVELLRTPVTAAPTAAGGRLFTLDRAGDADQAVLVVRSAVDRDGVPARTILDPVVLGGGHDATASIDWFHPSHDGRLVAFGMSDAGSERSTLRVLDVDSGTLLAADVIPDTRAASVAWALDGSGFAYTVYPPQSDFGRHVRWHGLGGSPGDDVVVFEALEDTTAWPDVSISDDGRWLVVHVEYGWTRTDVFLVERATGRRVTVIEGVEAVTWAQVVGATLWAWTNLDAGLGRVVRADVAEPSAWTTVVPERDDVIESLVVSRSSLLVGYGSHAASRLRRFALDGGGGEEIALPGVGSLAGLDGEPDRDEVFVGFTSFTTPPGVWRWTPREGGTTLEPWVVNEAVFDAAAFEVEQVRYPSGDGTSIPMFLVRHRSTVVGPSTPTVLTGYGGFGVSMSPAFGAGLVALCEAGVVYAVACLRGGSEYGEDWHRAGMLGNKQQSFDDFAAAATWLCESGRTSPERLAIRGGSNGGLLVGATITQRPDLCRAAVCAVPLLDMVRFDRFLIGALWTAEYGDPADPDAFRWLYAYSPYHHVDDGVAYPAVLLLTAESDSRVDPMHARKFAARLQAATSTGATHPVLLRVESRAGHGVGKPVTKQADELADTSAFVLWQLGAEVR
jgi:prolyl oligopeptidase